MTIEVLNVPAAANESRAVVFPNMDVALCFADRNGGRLFYLSGDVRTGKGGIRFAFENHGKRTAEQITGLDEAAR